jgi:hypothetical protein
MSIAIGVHQGAQLARNFDAQSLNPQPLPPKEVGSQPFRKLSLQALNPQPLPPKDLSRLLGSLFKPRFPNTLDEVALNPQPLPPDPPPDRDFSSRFLNTLNAVALNPQPLPPDPPPLALNLVLASRSFVIR